MAKRFAISVVISGRDKLSAVMNSITKGAMERIGHKITDLAYRLPQMAIEMVKLGAATKRQESALDSMAQTFGTSGDAIVDAIQGASDNTVDSLTAMQVANRAMLLDVAKAPDEFERLTKVAVKLGRVMGLDATQSINDFVTASGRQSIMIADNLGLTIKVGDANAMYARQLGKTVDQLTKAEQKQAFLNAMLEAGEEKVSTLGDTSGDLAVSMEQVESAIIDAKSDLAGLMAETVGYTLSVAAGSDGTGNLADSLGKLITPLQDAFHWFKAIDTTMREGTARGAGFRTEVERLHAELSGEEAAQEAKMIDGAASSFMALQPEIQAVNSYLAEQEIRMQDARLATVEASHAVGAWEQSLEGATVSAQQSVSAWESMTVATAEHTKKLEEERMALVEVAIAQGQLNEALSDVSDAQIAKIAIGELNLLLQSGALTADQYNVAVTGLQLTFGLTTEQTIGFKESMLALNEQLVTGMITAAEYDEALLLLTSDLPPTTAETMELQRAMDDAAREAQKLTDEAEMLSAMAGDTFVDAAGDAIDETDVWSMALFEAADAAGADAQELALLAGGLGIYTDEQIEAALATVALTTTIDQLGTAIANGSLTTAEAIYELRKQIDLMQFSIGVTRQNTSTTRRASGAVRENTKERQKAAKAARELARVERELERALARTGDQFVDAIENMEIATEEADEWAVALFEAADAAGADAAELATLAGALGLYTEGQLEAALAAAAMQEKMEQLGTEVAAGLGMDEAMKKLSEFREALLGVEDTVGLSANRMVAEFSGFKESLIGLRMDEAMEAFSEFKELLLAEEIAAGLGIDEATRKFNEFRESLGLPEWLEPGSMTPLEVGIRGIASAMRQLATIEMPALQTGAGPMGGDRVTTNQFNMTVNTRASMSTVQQDFATMAALVG